MDRGDGLPTSALMGPSAGAQAWRGAAKRGGQGFQSPNQIPGEALALPNYSNINMCIDTALLSITELRMSKIFII